MITQKTEVEIYQQSLQLSCPFAVSSFFFLSKCCLIYCATRNFIMATVDKLVNTQ